MQITVLGCGAAAGVPMVSRGWGDCSPSNPKNRRLRSSVFVSDKRTDILIDSGPDLREQLLSAGIRNIDAVLYTHLHADHTDGVNELREINRLTQEAIPIYGDTATIDSIYTRFDYAFKDIDLSKEALYHVILQKNIINPYIDFKVKDIEIKPFSQNHCFMDTLGFRMGDFAYSTDAVDLDEKAFEVLKGVKVWLVGCLSLNPHPSHAGLEKVLEWAKIVNPEQIYLTHMSIGMDYDTLCQMLPTNIRPAYDGMVIDI